jgi:hypothetical protein
MRNVLSGIIGCLLVLATLKAVEVGHCFARLEEQQGTIKQLQWQIQKTNRNTALAIARQRRDMESLKPQAPCDLTGYVFKPVGE